MPKKPAKPAKKTNDDSRRKKGETRSSRKNVKAEPVKSRVPAEVANSREPHMVAIRRGVFLEALKEGASIRKACLLASLDRSTIAAWRAKDAAFADVMDEAIQDGLDLVEDALFENATEKQNVIAQIFTLKCRRPERWRETSKVEVTVGVTPGAGFMDKFSKFADMVTGKYESLHVAVDEVPQIIDVTPPATQAPRLPRPPVVIDAEISPVEQEREVMGMAEKSRREERQAQLIRDGILHPSQINEGKP